MFQALWKDVCNDWLTHMRTLQEARLTEFKQHITEAAYRDLCGGEHMQALIAKVVAREQVRGFLQVLCQAA